MAANLPVHDIPAAAEASTLAMQEAEASGEPAVRARAMHAAGVGLLPGTGDLAFAKQFIDTAEEAGDLEAQFAAYASLILRHLVDGRRGPLDDAAARLGTIVDQLRSPRFAGTHLLHPLV